MIFFIAFGNFSSFNLKKLILLSLRMFYTRARTHTNKKHKSIKKHSSNLMGSLFLSHCTRHIVFPLLSFKINVFNFDESFLHCSLCKWVINNLNEFSFERTDLLLKFFVKCTSENIQSIDKKIPYIFRLHSIEVIYCNVSFSLKLLKFNV